MCGLLCTICAETDFEVDTGAPLFSIDSPLLYFFSIRNNDSHEGGGGLLLFVLNCLVNEAVKKKKNHTILIMF